MKSVDNLFEDFSSHWKCLNEEGLTSYILKMGFVVEKEPYHMYPFSHALVVGCE
jgi:hypothetical protein